MQVTIVDTNVLLPKWDYEIRDTTVPRKPSGYLPHNHAIDQGLMQKAIDCNEQLIAYLQSRQLMIPEGVAGQTRSVLKTLLDSYEERRSKFVFTEFNGNFSDAERERNHTVYPLIKRHWAQLERKREITDANEHIVPENKTYRTLDAFVKDVKLRMGEFKTDHRFDDHTDESIVVVALYEALRNGNEVDVVTNDQEVGLLTKLTGRILQKMGPLYDHVPAYNTFVARPPLALQWFHDQQQPEPWNKDGIVDRWAYTHLRRAPSNHGDKQGYSNATGDNAEFLLMTVDRIIESLADNKPSAQPKAIEDKKERKQKEGKRQATAKRA